MPYLPGARNPVTLLLPRCAVPHAAPGTPSSQRAANTRLFLHVLLFVVPQRGALHLEPPPRPVGAALERLLALLLSVPAAFLGQVACQDFLLRARAQHSGRAVDLQRARARVCARRRAGPHQRVGLRPRALGDDQPRLGLEEAGGLARVPCRSRDRVREREREEGRAAGGRRTLVLTVSQGASATWEMRARTV